MSKLSFHILRVTPFQQNCTFLFDEESLEAVVVDPGGDVEKIKEVIKCHNFRVKQIWITHGHIDHVGGAAQLKEDLSLEIIGPHKHDASLMERLEEQAKLFSVCMDARNTASDLWLQDGDSVSFGKHIFKVLHCPGHSPGHVVYVNFQSNFAHLGDVLFRRAIGRTDIINGNQEQLLTSIREKILPLSDNISFVCGHGPSSSIGIERLSNPFIKGL
ncbi:MBL fold metallo-hydrolase [Candidatus Liberibacter sp.]|uniref:MBL fold metallo-hydrolase n=1 Tax=Candidatus Liberibacter sp. TaxID=34022 RepID=UPI0015F5DCD0|nr:MBL fold metallo-hydrolase [Candidatus Liberibacter sp.]MBA5723903.1 MBL fold metallo-hydrolase [Candidatus Liberibacter sp.]